MKGREILHAGYDLKDDRDHYRKIIHAVSETIRLMKEIDAAIPKWPIE